MNSPLPPTSTSSPTAGAAPGAIRAGAAAAAPAPAAPAVAPPSPLLEIFERMGLEIPSGDGVTVQDKSGRKFLDFYGGHAVASLGYGHPYLVEALTNQARRLFFQSNAVDLEIRVRAAARLVKFAPLGLTRVFFVNSGAEAIENALRVAFLLTKRPRVVAVAGAFHGRTAAAAAITDHHDGWYAFPRKPFDVTWVPFDDVSALQAALGPDVAAVIFEPVQGVAGARPLSKSFVHAAREVTQRHGALLILDEVQIGIGRSGSPFAAQHYGITPDVLATAKGIAGGFPCGALLVGEAIAAQLKRGQLGTTFGGGPMACALVDATLRAIEDQHLLERVKRVSKKIFDTCCVGPVEGIQGLGLLIGLRTRRPAREVLADLRAHAILAGTSHDAHVVRLMPPLILEEAHVEQLATALSAIPA
ncbi:MAG TPA: aminotransferase class III-fold pyridoxal phosphate-dependent enzyme [Planctomycetota bacterium]|nr:aminotransferase class III-fold pyridoxal phosphate-dependent enzyme [Planctomycetota bacterium]